MKIRISKLLNSKFLRNVILVASGTAGAQAITMLLTPLITRLYGPEVFGLLGSFTAVLAIATPIAALSYPIAIVLPKADDEAKAIAKLAFRIALAIALILVVILLIAGNELATLLGIEAISNFLLLIPLAMFFNALHQIMQQWLIRKKQFKVTARVALSQSLILNSSKLAVGWFHPFSSVLIVLTTLGSALHALQLWFGAKKWADEEGRIVKITKKVSLKKMAYKYRDFPYFRAPQVFINALSQSLPVLMLATFSGPAAAGFYSLGRTVMGLPSGLIGSAVGNVFYPKIAEAVNLKQKIHQPILKATVALALVGIVPYGAVSLFGPWLFELVFGKEWLVAGEYARWLALWLYFGFINGPSVSAIPVLGMQRFFLIYELISLVLRAGSLYLGFSILNSDVQAVILFSASGVILNCTLIFITLLKGKRL